MPDLTGPIGMIGLGNMGGRMSQPACRRRLGRARL